MSTGLVACRYNKNHKVKNSRLLFHERTCPNKDTEKVVVCSYDPSHKIKATLINEHEKTCPRRPKEDKDLLSEMEMYINSQTQINRNINNNSNNVNMENSVNSTNRSVRRSEIAQEPRNNQNVVGLRKTNEKKKKIEEEKNFHKLIEKEFEEVENMSITYPENNDESVNFHDQEEEKKFDSFMRKQGANIKEEIKEYNPNESVTYERNNLNKSDSEDEEDEDEDEESFDNSENDVEESQSKDYNEFDSNFMNSYKDSREGGR